MEHGHMWMQYLAAAAVSLSSITAGASFSWATPAMPKFHNNQTNGIHLSDNELSWLASMSAPGYVCGSLMSRFSSDRIGRRVTIYSSAIPNALGTMFIIYAYRAWMFYSAKFLWGFSAGLINTAGVIYVGEIADKSIRGKLLVSNRFMLNLGCFMMMAIGPFMPYDALNYSMLSMPTIYFIACWFIPESPYYLLKIEKVDAARKVLCKLTGIKDETVLEEKLTVMRADVKNEMRRSGTVKELFTGIQYRKALIIVFGLKAAQMCSGSTAIPQYFGLISQASNSGMKVSTALIIFGAVRFSVGVLSSLLIDKLGRRPLLIYSFLGTSIFFFIVGGYFYAQEVLKLDNEILKAYSLVPFLGLICSSILSFLGFDSVAYALPAELFPINVKSIAMTSLNIFSGSTSFANVKGYQVIKNAVGYCGVFWFFSISSFLGFVFSYLTIVETKGKSLKEIQMELQGDMYDDDTKLTKIMMNGSNGVSHVENITEMTSLKEKEER